MTMLRWVAALCVVFILWFAIFPAHAVIRVDQSCWDTWDGQTLTHQCYSFTYDDGVSSGGDIRGITAPGGGGGGTIPNKGSTSAPERDANQKDCAAQAGNPVIFSTGNKIEPEEDFTSAGEMPLSLTRTYNYYWNGIGIFGRRWLSDYDYKLLLTTDDPTSTCYPRPGSLVCDATNHPIWAQRPDGRKIKFNYSTTPAPGWYEDKPVPVARIFANAGTYTLYSEDHTVETYDSGGFPTNIRDQQSIGWTFTYDANHYLSRVTHTSGRYVSFTWSNGLLASVTDPAGNLYSYSFTLLPATAAASSASSMPASILHQAAVMQPNLQMDPGPDDPPPTPPSPPIQTMVALLTGVTQPGTAGYSASTNVSYQYENPTYKTALTGKTVNGSRFATYIYDSNGRVQQSGHANGAETYTFSYSLDANGAVTAATVTNPLGKQASYAFNALGDQVSITGVASTHCPASYKAISYDANGNPEASTDFNGNITSSTYSPNGLLQEQVVGYQTPVARRTTVTWDTTINRPLTIAVQGDHETDYTYTSDGRLATVSTKNLASTVAASAGQVHTTTYTYTKWPNGMLSSAVIDGPLSGSGDAITTTYSQSGDLLSTKDALGHATVYDSYNGLGKPGSVVGPNGDRHAFTFDARGRLIVDRTYRNQATQDKVYEYDGFGRLARVTNPDGQMHSYQYDVAGRLIEEYQPEAGGAYSATIYQYNAMSLPTSIVVERVYSEPKRGTVQ